MKSEMVRRVCINISTFTYGTEECMYFWIQRTPGVIAAIFGAVP